MTIPSFTAFHASQLDVLKWKSLRAEEKAVLYILLGEDDFSLRQSLEEIKRSAGDPALIATNTTTLDGQQLTPDQLRSVCETLPFLAERRLVIVSGLLERFEPKTRTGRSRRKAVAANEQHNGSQPFRDCINRMPESTVLVLVDGKIGSNNPLFSEISKKALVKSFPLLRDAALRQWIQQCVKEKGGSIAPQAIELLAKLVGGNLWVMSNEVDKLVSLAAGRRIEQEDVRTMVSYARETSVFAMVDAILESKAGLAEQMLQRLLDGGAAPVYLLAMLSRQMRMIVQMKELRRLKKSRAEIQERLGSTSDFLLRKTSEQANRYPWERIREVYHKLLETDLAIKTGKYHEELALDILIAEICRQGKP